MAFVEQNPSFEWRDRQSEPLEVDYLVVRPTVGCLRSNELGPQEHGSGVGATLGRYLDEGAVSGYDGEPVLRAAPNQRVMERQDPAHAR